MIIDPNDKSLVAKLARFTRDHQTVYLHHTLLTLVFLLFSLSAATRGLFWYAFILLLGFAGMLAFFCAVRSKDKLKGLGRALELRFIHTSGNHYRIQESAAERRPLARQVKRWDLDYDKYVLAYDLYLCQYAEELRKLLCVSYSDEYTDNRRLRMESSIHENIKSLYTKLRDIRVEVDMIDERNQSASHHA